MKNSWLQDAKPMEVEPQWVQGSLRLHSDTVQIRFTPQSQAPVTWVLDYRLDNCLKGQSILCNVQLKVAFGLLDQMIGLEDDHAYAQENRAEFAVRGRFIKFEDRLALYISELNQFLLIRLTPKVKRALAQFIAEHNP